MQEYTKMQKSICKKFKAQYCASPLNLRIGISTQLLEKDKVYPINGLRMLPESNTTGWYIWNGEGSYSTDEDFFKPLCLHHIKDYCPEIISYLGLAPGWRFLLAPNYEDVWFDANLLVYNK
jgi:hypothetical protein